MIHVWFCPMVSLHVFAHVQNGSHAKFYPVNSFKMWFWLWHCIECDMKSCHKCHSQCGLLSLQEQILTLNSSAVSDYFPPWVLRKLTCQNVIYPNFNLLLTNIGSGTDFFIVGSFNPDPCSCAKKITFSWEFNSLLPLSGDLSQTGCGYWFSASLELL